ncbi:MAG TPA: ATP-binding protein [Ignavibacteriaceae bacterium]|nr:ATP-binding protein [Ignavibacteriaceae bacterium]
MKTQKNIEIDPSLNDGHYNLQSILDLTDAIFLVITKNGNVTLINKGGCDLLGYSREEIVGKNWVENIVPKVHQDKLKEYFQKLFGEEGEIVSNFENPVITKSGKEIFVYWRNSLIKDEKGNTVALLSSGLDISERKRTDKIQQTISQILQASNTGSDLIDFFRFIHSSVGELMPAENFYIALHDKDANIITFPYFVDQVDKVAPPKRLGRGLTEYVLRNGKSILVNSQKDEELVQKGEVEMVGSPTSIWLGIPLKIQNATIGVLVVQDYNNPSTYSLKEQEILEVISFAISRAIERKRVEQEKSSLIEELREMNASKDKLIALISHDLRSPFNSLLGFSEILNSEYETLTHDEIQEYLKVIYESSKNLFNMTNNLLQFSRIQMGRVEYNPSKLNLAKMIRNSLNMLKGNAIKKQINLMLDVENDIIVNADEDMLNSIMQNLVSNAIKFTPKGGDVKISAKKIPSANQQNEIEIAVQDSGIGISKSDIEMIFNNSIHSTPGTDKEYGTGLGLLLVKEFVEKNGGKLIITSKLNAGSNFNFRLSEAN